MNYIQNLPIAYDFHGDTPWTVPFSEIKPQDIHIYLDLNTKTGKGTCGQNCAHCWFVNYEKVYNKSFRKEEGPLIKRALEHRGYKVFARYADSFAYEGEFMKMYGPAHNREFRQEADHKPTETMRKGDAWTSGRPLMADNYSELLDIARESGYGTISITFHGLIGPDLKLRAMSEYPISGVFPGAETEIVLRRIFEYNEQRRQNHGESQGFRTNIGLTLGKHNASRESLIRYAQYFNLLGVSTVRFNSFTDHGGRHPELELDEAGIAQAYRDIKWLHNNVSLKFQLAVSEDFGTFGVEVMEFPPHVGWCRAGTQLFTVIPATESVLSETAVGRREKIGDIVACVNIFEPYLGDLVRTSTSAGVNYELDFNHQAIADFTRQRLEGVYKNGCFAPEILEKKKLELTQQAQRAVARRQAEELDALPA